MKRLWLLSFLLSAALICLSCGSDEPENPQPTPEQPENPGGDDNPDPTDPAPGENGRYLVVFASRSGNTERVAQTIRTTLGCDVLEVEPSEPYEEDYNAMLERAQTELDGIAAGNFPAIRTADEDFSKYDIVFVGFPVWYNRIATPMQTFLHRHADKLAGKRVALFATSGGSSISQSAGDARTLCPDAQFTENLLLTSASGNQADARIAQWLERLGASSEETPEAPAGALSLKMTVGGQTITATMEDNAAARDLMSRLPFEVTLTDYNRTEKIFYPDPALDIEGVVRGCTPEAGDITIYAPWGNVAIFYKEWPQSGSLIKIGHIDGNGINVLSAYSGDVHVRMENNE